MKLRFLGEQKSTHCHSGFNPHQTPGLVPQNSNSALFDSGSVEIPGLTGNTVTGHPWTKSLECMNILNF